MSPDMLRRDGMGGGGGGGENRGSGNLQEEGNESRKQDSRGVRTGRNSMHNVT